MARIPEIESRLLRWAEVCKVGDGSGYPATNVLDPSWSPPSAGMVPGVKAVPASDHRQTGRAVGMLRDRLRAAVVAHYIKRMGPAQAGAAMGCRPDTVAARIDAAHRALLQVLRQKE